VKECNGGHTTVSVGAGLCRIATMVDCCGCYCEWRMQQSEEFEGMVLDGK
jgi:hypothetical protein